MTTLPLLYTDLIALAIALFVKDSRLKSAYYGGSANR